MEQKKSIYYDPVETVVGSILFAFITMIVTAFYFSGYNATISEALLLAIFTIVGVTFAGTYFDRAKHENAEPTE